MCGRYAFYLPPSELKKKLGLDNLLNIPPRYNCGPIQELPIVIKNRMGYGRWGFRPEWSKSDDSAMAAKMINARSETVSEKPAFKNSWLQSRRCLVPANGFYEWAKDERTGTKQPYYIQNENAPMLLFAGLWSKVDEQVSFTILTKQADENLDHLHHRSPVIVELGQASQWFEGDAQAVHDIIKRSTTQRLRFHPVSPDVGKVANDHEGLIAEIEIPQQTEHEGCFTAQGSLL